MVLTRSKVDSKTNGNNGTDMQTKGNARKKEKNYTREEDIFLCRAWMTTPEDPEEETDQPSGTFWGRTKEKYENLIGSNYVSRAGKSLPQRWSRIRTSVSKFCAVYKNIRDQNRNSHSKQDMIKMALLAYKKEKKENFSFLHCWTELRNSSKWKDEGASKYGRRNIAQQSSIDEHFNHDDDNDCPTPTDKPLEQSKRQKLTKHCARKGTDAVMISLSAEPSPLSAVSMPSFNCSSRAIKFDPDNKTARSVQKKASEQVTTKNKESIYSREEDMFLCMAWKETSGPSAKDDQFSMTVWQRIGEQYRRLIGNNYISRIGKSLLGRWYKIKPDVLKFCYIYENINGQNSNGYTEKDKIHMARVTFKKKEKRKFRFYHCWTVLRDSPKWNEMVTDARPRMDFMYSEEPITTERYGLDDHYDSPIAMDTSLEQLEGQGLTEKQLESVEGEGLCSPPAASSPLSALSTPVLLSGEMGFHTQDHVGDDVKTQRREQVNTKKKESNYSQEEDVFLCRAWMKTKDPNRGRDQSSMTLWGKIGEAYASLIGDEYAPRVGKSLPQRWSRIRVAVLKFCSIYKNISDQNPNSCTETDKINMAMLAYQKEQKEKFKFLHCWTELRDSSKWKFESLNGIHYRGRHCAMLSQQSSSDDDDSDDDNDDSPMPLDKPKEQEPAVRKRKRHEVDTSSSDMEELLPRTHDLVRETLMDQPQVKKLVSKKHDLARELLEIEREKRETKIMLIDPTTLPEGRRQYFEKLQQKILERVCGKPSSSN